MQPNPVSSLAPAGITPDCDLQKKIAALDAIADDLPAVVKTAQTHRRNIKAKLNAQSNYDITQFAQAFDLI